MKSVYSGGVGAIVSYFGLVYSWTDSISDNLDWLSVVERLGVPTAFLIALIWMLYKASKAAWPFLQGQITRLVDIPNEQLKVEREARQAQQLRYESTMVGVMEKQSESNIRVADSLEGLTHAITKLAEGKGEEK